jgi:hypothetical protein
VQFCWKTVKMSKAKKISTYTPEIIYINLSSSFMARARCKYCQSGPTEYSVEKGPNPIRDHSIVRKHFNIVKKVYKKICYDFYLDTNPSAFNSLAMFKHSPSYKSLSSHAFRSRLYEKSECKETLWCPCGLTAWAFNNKGSRRRPEISQRKARYRYPHKFDY